MKLIIDEEKIIDLLETEWGYEGIREEVSKLLRENGTPYKPTGDCISRSELLKHSYGGDYDGCGGFTREYVYVKDINNAPTVEPERPKGEWIGIKTSCNIGHKFYYCSKCTREIDLIEGESLDDYPFCHCGADMREEEVKS